MLQNPRLRNLATFPHVSEQNIRFGDLDRHNHVNNIVICSYIEDARVRLREERFPEVAQDRSIGWYVVDFHISFLASLTYPGNVQVGTGCVRIGNSSYTLVHGVFGKGECIATASTITVFGERDTGTSRPLPEIARKEFQKASITLDE